MMKAKYLCIVAVFVLSPLAAVAQTDEEYRIYDAVIRNMFSGKNNYDVDTGVLPKLTVIEEKLISFKIDDSTPGKEGAAEETPIDVLGISRSTYDDFKSKAKFEGTLSRSFDPKLNYTIISQEKLKSFFGSSVHRDGWKAYYKEFPDSGGFISFSRVGFNDSKTEAFLHFQHSCGSLCASGYYLVLHKAEDKWKVTKRRMLWIS